jgi:hypothetical protein
MELQVSFYKESGHYWNTGWHASKAIGNVQKNDKVALNLSAARWLAKTPSFHLTHFHILRLHLYLAYSNSTTHHEITTDLCDWWTFVTSKVFLEGQIWSFHLQLEVVTNIHQTDTLLTHKCRQAITWLDLENIKITHVVRYRVLIWWDPYCWSLCDSLIA